MFCFSSRIFTIDYQMEDRLGTFTATGFNN